MHSVEELGTNVPAFLAKLWKMVEDSETNDLICWSPSGTSFYIRDQAKFARELLPLYYKHNNMASFVRQLNMYGFHKVVSIESGGLKIDRDDMEFAHQYFLMGHPYLLEHIKRKIPTNKSDDGRSGAKPEFVNKVLAEVKSLKGRQDSVDTQLSAMKRENEVLWREVAILRQKHIKQQQIVNKLIQFLVSMVQTSRGGGIGIKRHYPLMLNDITHHSKKTAKLNGNISDVNSVSSNLSPTGPVIHELDPAELLDDVAPSVDDENSASEFDLCDAVNARSATGNMQSTGVASTASLTASLPEATVPAESIVTVEVPGANDCDLDDQTSNVLLELAEECPLSNDELVTPENTETYLAQVRPNKGKQKSNAFKGIKRRKTKMSSVPKTTNPLITIKTERADPEEPVNVNNFLEIMLPSLVSDANNTERPPGDSVSNSIEEEVILPDLCEESLETDERNNQSSLEAATDAAISAISNVAAQAAAEFAAGSSARTDAEVAVSGTSKTDSSGGSKLMSDTVATEANGASSKDLTLACASSGDQYKCKEDFDCHLENMQTELDTLKELLKGDGYNLDANMLLGVCAAGLGIDANTIKLFSDDTFSYGLPIAQDTASGKNVKQNGVSDPMVSGSELMTYSSNLLDLADMSGLEDWGLSGGTANFTGETNEELNTPLVTINSPGFSGAIAKKKKTK